MFIVGMIAETFIHPGSGQSLGAIDLPVARERASGLPYIAGSSMKGAFRQVHDDRAQKETDKEKREGLKNKIYKYFGKELGSEGAGAVLFSDARLLILPVRSLTTRFVLLTCPMLLRRLDRDLERIGDAGLGPATLSVDAEVMLVHPESPLIETEHYLEDRSFKAKRLNAETIQGVDYLLGKVVGDAAKEMRKFVGIVSDDDFLWFCSFGLHVQARNNLDKRKVSKNLWYEELLSPDTVFYTMLGDRLADGDSCAEDVLAELKYLQVGGNETLGQGWFRLCKSSSVSKKTQVVSTARAVTEQQPNKGGVPESASPTVAAKPKVGSGKKGGRRGR